MSNLKFMSGIIEGSSVIAWEDSFRRPTVGLSMTVRVAAKSEHKPGQRLDRSAQAKTLNFIVAKGQPGFIEFKSMPVGTKFEASLTRAAKNTETGSVSMTFDEVIPVDGEDFEFEAPEFELTQPKTRKFYDSKILE